MRFSLMELGVTTFIISSVAMLVPKAIQSAEENAIHIECMQTLKQLGAATILYSETYQGYLPHEDFGSTQPPWDSCWYEVLDEFVELNPKYKAKQDPSLLDLHNTNLEECGFSYKMNSRLEDYKGKNQVASGPFRHTATIGSPERTVLFFDGDISQASIRQRPYGMYLNVVNRHINKANLLLLDGHVKNDAGSNKEEHWKGPGGYLWDPDVEEDQQ